MNINFTQIKQNNKSVKRPFLLSLFWLLSLGFTFAQGPVAYYPFNGNANDASGNTNNGTITGATLTTDRFGNANSAYSFNGVDNKIVVPYDNTMSLGSQFTVTAWVQTTDGIGSIFSQHSGGGTGNFVFAIWDVFNSGEFLFAPSQSIYETIYSGPVVNDGLWHHLAGVYDHSNSVVYYYVDGVLSKSIQNPAALSNTLVDFIIGDEGDGFFQYEGKIDEIRLYNRALSEIEISSLYQETSFITTWEVVDPDLTINIFSIDGLTYDFDIDWGDGTVLSNQTGSVSHTYASAGIKTISITGVFPEFSAYSKDKIRSIEQWGNIVWGPIGFSFGDAANGLAINATDAPDLSQVTSMKLMFKNLAFTGDNLKNWDVSNVEDMWAMFFGASFNEDLSSWNVSNATDLGSMFIYTGNSTFGDLSNWDVSACTNMAGMFSYATDFNSNISGWNVSNVVFMNNMFQGSTSFNQDISGWNVSNAEFMGFMFLEATIFNQPIGSWNVSKVIDMPFMFYDASGFDQDLGGWDISNVGNFDGIFTGSNLSLSNYDNTLIGWASLDAGEAQIPTNRYFGAGGLTYCQSGIARTSLINDYGWTITGDNAECNNGLIAYYPFNGNALDASGNGSDGIVNGGVSLVTDRFGNADAAYGFDGTDGHISISSLFNHPVGEVSVTYSAWVMPTAQGQNGSVFYVGDRFVNARSSMILAGGDLAYIGENNDFRSNTGVYLDEWSHVAVTKSGTSVTTYINGVEVSSGNVTTGQDIASIAASIGSTANNDEFFNGKIDDVRVYDRPLTANEIAALYSENGYMSQRDILMTLYEYTGGDNWNDKTNWGTTESIANWFGVEASNGVVTYLDVRNNNLNGTIPKELGGLYGLQYLILFNDAGLFGGIPYELGNLRSLLYMAISLTNVSGEIPASIGNLSNLQTLILSRNNLSGDVPIELTNLSNLQTLSLFQNQLTSIPDFTGITSLTNSIRVESNKIGFSDIIQNLPTTAATFLYSPQTIGDVSSFIINNGEQVNLDAIEITAGTNYQWYFNGEIIDGANLVNHIFTFSSIDEGVYHCVMTNDNVPGLTITRANILLDNGINVAPTDLQLSNFIIEDGTLSGSLIGTLATIDEDPADTHSYALIAGTGDIDNNNFYLEGDKLYIGVNADYSQNQVFQLRISTTDNSGQIFEKEIEILVKPAMVCSNSFYQASSGTFSDGSGIFDYENNFSCSWSIQLPEGEKVKLSFISFNTEADYDFVRVYDGLDDTGTLLAELSGDYIPSNVYSPSNTMYITFIADGGVVAPGFEAGYSTVVPVAYFPFNGNALDESGNGVDGTVNEALLVVDRFGNADAAYNFDGANDFISGDASSFPSGAAPRTISGWVNVPDQSGYLFTYGNTNVNGGSFALGIQSGLPVFWGHFADLTGTQAINFNEWVFLSITYDGVNLSIYVNGQLDTSAPLTLDTQPATSFNIATGWSGTMDDISIYDYALSALEIENLYNKNGWPNVPTNLVANLSSAEGKRWKLAPSDRAFYVGPEIGSDYWYANTQVDVLDRDCLFDDQFIFYDDGTFVIAQNGSVWGEDYLGGFNECTTIDQLAPAMQIMGQGLYTYSTSLSSINPTITVSGDGAYIGFSKVFNGGEYPSDGTGTPVSSITYTVIDYEVIDDQEFMTISIEFLTGSETAWWTFELVHDPLVANYVFNDNADDQTSNNYDGVINGVASVNDRFGAANAAYSFDGVSNFIQTDATLEDNTPFTLSTWVKWDGNNTNYAEILSWWNINASGQTYLGTSPTTNEIRFGDAWPTTGVFLPVNVWVNLVATYDGSVARIYLDGNLAATSAAGQNYGFAGGNLFIGVQGTQAGEFFGGLIDDIEIYSRQLSDAEILSKYEQNKSDIIIYYPFRGDLADAAGNGFDGFQFGSNNTFTYDRIASEGGAYNAYKFEYINSDLIEASNTANYDFGDEITVMAWIRPDTYQSPDVTLLSNVFEGIGFGLKLVTGDLTPEEATYKKRLYAELPGISYGPAGEVLLDRWTHVAFRYKRNIGTTLFINGQDLGTYGYISGTEDSTVPISAINVQIGNGYDGVMDEVKIYATGLANEEIYSEYSKDLWPFANTTIIGLDGAVNYPLDNVTNDVFGNETNVHAKVIDIPAGNYQINGEGNGLNSYFGDNELDGIAEPFATQIDLNAGFHAFRFDHSNLSYFMEPINSIGLIGSARTGDETGWIAEDELVDLGNGIYQIKNIKLYDGEWKLRLNNQWNILDWGWQGIEGQLAYIGQNIPISAGTYTISVDLINNLYTVIETTPGYWETVAELAFDGNLLDQSGYENHGTSASNTYTTDRFGVANGAISLGANELVNIGTDPELNLNNGFTMNMWINPIDNNNAGGLFSSAGSFHQHLYNNFIDWRYFQNGQEFPINGIPVIAPNNVWTMFTWVYDGAEMRFYDDGQLVHTEQIFGGLDLPGNAYEIGNGYDGAVDEFIWVDGVLNDYEILSLYNDGFVANYELNGNVIDNINGYDGLENGSPIYTSDRFGNLDAALSFDAIDDFVDLGINPGLHIQNEITLAVWIKTADIQQSGVLTWGNGFRLELNAENQTAVFGSWGLSDDIMFANYFVSDGKWHYLVGTYDGSTKKFYVDGVLRNEATNVVLTGDPYNYSSSMLIGSNVNSDLYRGSIDHASILDRAMTEEEIIATYHDSNWDVTNINDFFIDDLYVGQIDFENGIVNVSVPSGTDISAIGYARMFLSRGASTEFVSEELGNTFTADFTNPVGIRVTGYDGTVRDWTINVSVDKELIAHFNFDGNVLDQTGNGYDAVDLSGSTSFPSFTIDPQYPTAGESYLFDRSHQLTLANTASIDFGDEITVAAWIQPEVYDAGITEPEIISNLFEGNGFDFKLSSNSVTEKGLKAEVFGSTFAIQGNIGLNQWYHVAFTYKRNDAILLYINGIESGFNNVGDAGILPSTRELVVGSGMDGLLDDLKIFNRALTPEEIFEVYAENQTDLLPQVHSVSAAAAIPGSTVRIHGYNFDQPSMAVFINGEFAQPNIISNSLMEIVVPDVAYGTAKIVVVGSSGSSNEATNFTVLRPFTDRKFTLGNESQISTNIEFRRVVDYADLDNDGDLDLISGGEGSITLNKNLGGNFDGDTYIASGFNGGDIYSLTTADFDDDGDIDIAFSDPSSGKIYLIVNEGIDAVWPLYTIYTSGTVPYSIKLDVLDFDADGDLDLISANFGSKDISFLRNDGQYTFTSLSVHTSGYFPASIDKGDIDGDGAIDIVYSATDQDVGNGEIGWISYSGDGSTITPNTIINTQDDLVHFSLVDIDGNGTLDILSGSSFNSGKVVWFSNDGNGNFGAEQIIENSFSADEVIGGDLDGDGDEDIIAITFGSANGQTMFWYENLGNSTFSTRNEIGFTHAGASSVQSLDFDNDGDLDIAVSGYFSLDPVGGWVSIVKSLSSEAEILNFSLNVTGETYQFDDVNRAIDFVVPIGTDLSNLTPTFLISEGARAEVFGQEQFSGVTTQDFSAGLDYYILAEDGFSDSNWPITVSWENGIIADFQFNGNAVNEAIPTIEGNVVGAQITLDRFGNANSAYHFNSIDNQIELPTAVVSGGAAVTASWWVNVNDITGFNYVLDGGAIQIGSNEGFMYFNINGDTETATTLEPNQWIHYAGTYDGTTIKIYKNGVFEQQTGYSTAMGVYYSPSHIGSLNGTDRFMDGAIDDIKVYNYILTDEEILALYNVNGWPNVEMEPFESISENFDVNCLPPFWREYHSGSDLVYCGTFESNVYVNINGFGIGAGESWLIAPFVDFGAGDHVLNFDFVHQFNGPLPEILYSSDYDGSPDPTNFTWVNINEAEQIVNAKTVDNAFVNSGDIDLSALSEIGVIAFKYTSNGPNADESAMLRIDNFNISTVFRSNDPLEIILSSNSIDENLQPNTQVGVFTTVDDDSNTFTYSLVSGTGDADNASFTISGDQLLTTEMFDFETKSSYSILVRTDDGEGGMLDQQFTVFVNDIFEPLPGDPYQIEWIQKNVNYSPHAEYLNGELVRYMHFYRPEGTFGVLQKISQYGEIIWISDSIKFDANNISGDWNPYSFEIDGSGNIYALGTIQGSIKINGNILQANNSGYDMLVVKYDPDGNIVRYEQIGGAGNENGYGFILLPSGNLLLSFYFDQTFSYQSILMDVNVNSSVYLELNNSLDPTGVRVYPPDSFGNLTLTSDNRLFISGNGRVGLRELNISDYSELASHNLPEAFEMYAHTGKLVVDSNNDLILTATEITTSAQRDNLDIFIGKFITSTNTWEWYDRVGGAGEDFADRLGIDNQDNIYLGGGFRFSWNWGGVGLSSRSEVDIFLTKYDNAGNLLWIETYGSSIDGPNGASDFMQTMAVDPVDEDVFLSAYFQGIDGVFLDENLDGEMNMMVRLSGEGATPIQIDPINGYGTYSYIEGSLRGFFSDTYTLSSTGAFTAEALINYKGFSGPDDYFNAFINSNYLRIYTDYEINEDIYLRAEAEGDPDNNKNDFYVGNKVESSEFAPNVWHHVALVVGNGSMNLYLDGKVVHSGISNFSPVAVADEFLEVIRNQSADVDEVRIWNNARYGDELFPNISKELILPQAGLTGYWRFNSKQDDGAGFYTPDLTDRGNHLYLSAEADIVEVNVAPSNILLSNASIIENRPVGTLVGTLSSVDDNTADTHTYRIISGLGDDDNADFEIVNGAEIVSKAIFNLSVKATYTIRVETNDGQGGIFARPLIITILQDPNNPPVITANQIFSVEENKIEGTVVGTVDATDPDGNAITFSILSGNTNNAFAINEITGVITVADRLQLDYESFPAGQAKFELTIQVSDNFGTANAVVTINIIDVDETVNLAPQILDQSLSDLLENSSNGTVVGQVIAIDPNGDGLSYAITFGNSGNAFAISTSGEITVANQGSVDYESSLLTDNQFVLTVEVTDDSALGVLSSSATITIKLIDVNENFTPTAISFAGGINVIPENEAPGATMLTLQTTDADPGDSHTYTIMSDPTSSFKLDDIENNKLVSRKVFNFEVDPTTYTIQIRTDDGNGGVFDQNMTINISDENDGTFITNIVAPTAYTLGGVGVTVTVNIEDEDGLQTTSILYRKISASNYTEENLTDLGGGSYSFALQNDKFDNLGVEFAIFANDGNGATTSEISIIYSEVASDAVDITSVITPGSTVQNYSIIAFPFRSVDLNAVFTELGPYDNSKWRLIRYNNGSYQDYRSPFTTVSAGTGYWFITTDNTAEIKTGGQSVALVKSVNNEDNVYKINLTSGYNLIGNPFQGTLNWNAVVQHNLDESIITTGDVPTTLTRYNREFISGSVLNELEGAFVQSTKAISNFEIPVSAISGGAGRSTLAINRPEEVYIDDPSWQFDLFFKTPTYSYSIGGIGLDPQASDFNDVNDMMILPRFDVYLDLSFEDGNTRSIKESDGFKTWEFKLNSNLPEKFIDMTWDIPVSSGKTIIFVDAASQQIYDLSEVRNIQLANNTSVKHQLYYGDKDEIFAKLNLPFDALFNIYPNPVRNVLNLEIYAKENKSSVIEFISIEGKSVYRELLDLQQGVTMKQIDLLGKSIPNGVYLISIDSKITTKFIKQ